MKKRYILFFFLIFLLFCWQLDAQITNKESITNQNQAFKYEQPTVESPSYFWLFIKTLFILAIFLGAIYLVFKYITQKQRIIPFTRDIIKLRSSVPLGTNRFIHLVEVGTHYFLIGSSDAGINLISELTDNESLNMIKAQISKQPEFMPEKISFIQFIKDILGSIPKKTTKDKTSAGVGDFSFLKRQKERLKNLNNNFKK